MFDWPARMNTFTGLGALSGLDAVRLSPASIAGPAMLASRNPISVVLRAANIPVSPSAIMIRVDLCPLYSIEAGLARNSEVQRKTTHHFEPRIRPRTRVPYNTSLMQH